MTEITFPNYNQSILSLITSVLRYYQVETPYLSLKEVDDVLSPKYKNVVLMVFDALGSSILEKHLTEDSFLRQHKKRDISSVFPSTTAAAMPVFYSGLPPIKTGWLSSMCYFKEQDRVISLYKNQDFYTREYLSSEPVRHLLPFESVYSQIETQTQKRVRATELSPFNDSTLSSVEEMMIKIKKICQEPGEQFVLSYWPQPDALMHTSGTNCAAVKNLICQIDSCVRALATDIQETLIFVTADHGHIDLDEEIYIDAYPELEKMLSHPLSFEDRVVSVFLKEEYKEAFKPTLMHLFPNEFLVLSRQEVLDNHLFGWGEPHPKALEFIGDCLIVSIGKKSLRHVLAGSEKQPALSGSHAGLLKEETEVPLIIVET